MVKILVIDKNNWSTVLNCTLKNALAVRNISSTLKPMSFHSTTERYPNLLNKIIPNKVITICIIQAKHRH